MSSDKAPFLIMFAVFLMIAFFFWRAADRAVLEAADLDAQGVTVQGVVTDRDTGTLANSGGQQFYEISFSYTVAARAYDGATRTSRQIWEGYGTGDPIEVTYLPNDPEVHRALERGNVGAGLPWRIFAIIFALAGGAGLVFQLIPKRRRNT